MEHSATASAYTHVIEPDLETSSVPDPQPVLPEINVSGPDERGACVQLAARWAERYASPKGDSERAALERFRTAHDYVDDVIHGIEPQSRRP
jgi:hypothetical protein